MQVQASLIRRGLCFILLFGSMQSVRVAYAECTEWDLIVSDCYTGVVRMRRWEGSYTALTYGISPSFPQARLSAFAADIDGAASAWSGAADKLDIVHSPPEDANRHIYVHPQTLWTGEVNAAAQTIFTAGGGGIVGLGMITVTEIEINFDDYTSNDFATSTPDSGKLCFPKVMLHEFGHAIGLWHVTTECSGTVMDPAKRDDTELTLGAKDETAADILYGTDNFTIGPALMACTVEKTWGEVKSDYLGYRNYSRTMALSGASNTIVWTNDSATRNLPHGIYRSEGDSDVVTYLGTVSSGDSAFVDNSTAFGKRYKYHIATEEDSTLVEVGTPVAGLKLVHDHVLTDAISTGGYPSLAVRGSRVYAPLEVAPGTWDVRCYDVSNPSQLIELGRRSSLEWVSAMALSEDGTRLYVMTYTGFLVLDTTQSSMPIMDQLTNLVTGNNDDKLSDMAVATDVVYLASGIRGIRAVRVSPPTDIQIVGTYDPDGASNNKLALGVELARDAVDPSLYVYVSLYDVASYTGRYDRVQVIRHLSNGQLYSVGFQVACTSDSPSCWNGLTSGTGMDKRIDGGHFELGYSTGPHPYTIMDVRDPAKPVAVRQVDAPAIGPAWVVTDTTTGQTDTLSFFSTFDSYDFDSRFLYATTPMFFDPYDRSLVAFDIWGSGTGLLYAAGDMLGNSLGGAVRSQEKYVYLLDCFKAPEWSQHKPRIRIYEKATGCQPDPEHPVRILPIADAYRVGERLGISLAIGCPTSVTVELLQDGVVVDVIGTQNYSVADDVAHSFTWPLTYSTPNFENHQYAFRATAAYPNAASQSFLSGPFRIEVGETREVAIGGGKPFASIQAAIDASASGDTVLVYGGTYGEHLILKSNVHVVGKLGPSGERLAHIAPTTVGDAASASAVLYPPTLQGLEFHAPQGVSSGAVSVTNCGIRVLNCEFNSLTTAAVNISEGYGEFESCVFSGNQNAQTGGAVSIAAVTSEATIFSECQFLNNSAGVRGGAVYLGSTATYSSNAAPIQFQHCMFSGNSAPDAAAVRVGANRRPLFKQCIFSGNHATASSGGSIVGGAANASGGASAAFENCTFAANTGTYAYEVIRLEPGGSVPAASVQATIFASNANSNALGSTFGASYSKTDSDFFGNASGDVTWAGSGTGNFSANPAFCPSGDYSIYAFSPCAAGVTRPVLVGAKEIACAPAATVTVASATATPPDSLVFGCPKGDGETLSIQVAFDAPAMTRNVQANELSIQSPYRVKGLFASDAISGDTPAVAPSYVMTLDHPYISSYGREWVTLLLNGYPLAQKAYISRRGPDLKSAGPTPTPCGQDLLCPDGKVSMPDYAYFTTHYPNGPYVPQCDFNGSGTITTADFSMFCTHYQTPNHVLPFTGPLLAPTASGTSGAIVSPTHVAMSFTDEYITALSRRLYVDLSLEAADGVSLCLFAIRTNRSDLTILSWEPTSWATDHVIFATVDREGGKEHYIGAVMRDDSRVASRNLGRLVFDVEGSSPIEIADQEFVLTVGDLQLGEDSQPQYTIMQGVEGSGIGRTINPAVQRVFHNRLEQNFPNPFNPQTTIAFSLKDAAQVRLVVYDVTGSRVRELANEKRKAGAYRIVWDGRNANGTSVASGVYFCRLVAGSFTETKKMILLK